MNGEYEPELVKPQVPLWYKYRQFTSIVHQNIEIINIEKILRDMRQKRCMCRRRMTPKRKVTVTREEQVTIILFFGSFIPSKILSLYSRYVLMYGMLTKMLEQEDREEEFPPGVSSHIHTEQPESRQAHCPASSSSHC
jgi:hypothetical protein